MLHTSQFQEENHFPFSPFRLRPALDQAEVNNPRLCPTRPSTAQETPWQDCYTTLSDPRPFRAGRISPPSVLLKLVRLDDFVWGSRNVPPRPRTRPDHVLLWLTEGRALLQFPGRDMTLTAGDLHHIPPGTAFATIPAAGCRGHVALIARPLADLAAPPLPPNGLAARLALSGQPSETRVMDCLRALLTEGADRQHMTQLSLLLQQLPPRSSHHTTHMALAMRPDGALIARFSTLVRENLCNDWTIADLGRQLGCSAAALDQACLATRGCRAIELVNRIRLERAFEALRHTRHSPAQIATECGYSSHAHFTRACVAATGRSPEAFRAQCG